MCSACNSCAGDGQRIAVGNGAKVLVRVRHSPQHVIAGVQQHGCVERLAELGSHRDVIVVAVRAHHRHHVAAADGLEDRFGGVGGVENHDVGVVADEPDVVVDFPTATVEFEGAVGDHAIDVAHYQHHHRAQHLAVMHLVECLLDVRRARCVRRRTSPSGSRPCRCRSIRVGKSRSGRQSPYQDDFNAPPWEKKSTSGMSRRMSGVGTPTRTTVPARSRA